MKELCKLSVKELAQFSDVDTEQIDEKAEKAELANLYEMLNSKDDVFEKISIQNLGGIACLGLNSKNEHLKAVAKLVIDSFYGWAAEHYKVDND